MKIAVLISGNGSNLQALLDSSVREEIKLVVSNRESAYGLRRALEADCPTRLIQREDFETRDDFDHALAQLLNLEQIDLVVLAGWMHILGPRYLDLFEGQTINLHPALPGCYAGTHAIERAFKDGVSETGCMVHRVTLEVDIGEVLGTRIVPMTDSLEELAQRMHQAEHELLVSVVESLAKAESVHAEI